MMERVRHLFYGALAMLSALLIVACSSSENPTRTSLNIDTSVLVLDLGQHVTRRASSKASGAVITYTSSNPDVAEVDANGTVYAEGEGECIITVSMAEDKADWYGAAKVQYKVIVDDFVNIVPESAKGPTPTPVPDPSPTPTPTPYIPVPEITPPVAVPYLLDIDYSKVAIGQVICLDDDNIARNYDADKVTSRPESDKVAMIAYLGTIAGYCSNGLAISFKQKEGLTWNEARKAWGVDHVPVFINAGWSLPTTDAIWKMTIACGDDNKYLTLSQMVDLEYQDKRIICNADKMNDLLDAIGGFDYLINGSYWTINSKGSDIWAYNAQALSNFWSTPSIKTRNSRGVLRF